MRGASRGQSQSARKPALPHTEAYQRMNFLYHAAHQVVATNPALARLYIRNMVLVAKKLVLRIDATMKATYCKGCFSLLIPGLSASARVAHGARRRYLVTCQHCGKAKRSMIHPPKPPSPTEGDATTVVGTEPGEKGSQFMGEDRREEAPGQEEEEMGLSASATRRERCLEVPKNHHSRFVYTNPACLLTAKGARADEPPHVAFVSRLSCINNNGLFFCALSKHLPGVATLGANSCFVLNVPVAGMEESIRCYATAAEQAEGEGEVDQAQTPECGLQVCKPGWYPREEEATEESTDAEPAAGGKGARGKNKPRGAIRAEMRQKKRDIVRGELDAKLKGNLALDECVAHIECSVESRDEAEGQVLLYAMIERVWVQPEYWTGKTFVHTREDVPPYLAYLGDGRFGYKHS